MQESNQNYGYIKINTNAVVNVIALILVIITTLFFLSSVSALPLIGSKVSNHAKIDNLSDSISKNSTISMLYQLT